MAVDELKRPCQRRSRPVRRTLTGVRSHRQCAGQTRINPHHHHHYHNPSKTLRVNFHSQNRKLKYKIVLKLEPQLQTSSLLTVNKSTSFTRRDTTNARIVAVLTSHPCYPDTLGRFRSTHACMFGVESTTQPSKVKLADGSVCSCSGGRVRHAPSGVNTHVARSHSGVWWFCSASPGG